MLKVIKSAEDYDAAVLEVERLMLVDPPPDTEEGIRLELLAFLISTYEDEHFPIDKPTPVEAIRFRMEQEGLTQRDLVPYVGSPGRVSEVLRGRRRLTLKMIWALHKGLHIPAEVLLQQPSLTVTPTGIAIEWRRFPVKEMAKRGWFSGFGGTPSDATTQAEKLIAGMLARGGVTGIESARLRQHVRSGSQMDSYALVAWWARVVELARCQSLAGSYKVGSIDASLMSDLTRLSFLAEGPILAKEYLSKRGIHVVILGHLPRTHLDGAAMLIDDGAPVVALTLRHDRLDNFWFCLFHELGHAALHLSRDDGARYFDNLDVEGDSAETEADRFAEEALIPPKSWAGASVRREYSPAKVQQYANRLRIHPAIVAGRIRREQGNYRILWSLVGKGQVRTHFPGLERGVS